MLSASSPDKSMPVHHEDHRRDKGTQPDADLNGHRGGVWDSSDSSLRVVGSTWFVGFIGFIGFVGFVELRGKR